MVEITNENMKDISGGSWFGCSLSFAGTVASAFTGMYFFTFVGALATADCIMSELGC